MVTPGREPHETSAADGTKAREMEFIDIREFIIAEGPPLDLKFVDQI